MKESKEKDLQPEQQKELPQLAPELSKLLSDLETRITELTEVTAQATKVIAQANTVLQGIDGKRASFQKSETGTSKTYKPIPRKEKTIKKGK